MYLLTTHIGGLPHYDVAAAVDLSCLLDIPCLPELRLRRDNIFSPIEKSGQVSCLDEFAKRVIDKNFEIVKIQIVGPVTAFLQGYDTNEYFLNLYKHFEIVANAMNIKNKRTKVMAFADEPSLYLVDFDFNYKVLYEEWLAVVKSFGINTTGIHSCGDLTDKIELRRFDVLFESEFDFISIDASKYDITKYPAYRGEKNEKRIAWGVDYGKNKLDEELRF